MTGKLSKNFHGVGIGPLSNILAVKYSVIFSCILHGFYKDFINLKQCSFTIHGFFQALPLTVLENPVKYYERE